MTRKQKIIAIAALAALTFLMTLFIFMNSLKVAEESAEASGRFVKIAEAILESVEIEANEDDISFFVRKGGHFLEYSLLGVITSLLLISIFEKKRFLILSPVYCFIVAVCDEFIMQASTEGRSPEWRDIGIDISGAVIALLLIVSIMHIIKRNRQKGGFKNI